MADRPIDTSERDDLLSYAWALHVTSAELHARRHAIEVRHTGGTDIASAFARVGHILEKELVRVRAELDGK